MPQSEAAHIATRGTSQTSSEASVLRNVVPLTAETRLSTLGDVIPEPAWLPKNNVISIGDLLLGLGLAVWAFQVTAASPRRTPFRARAQAV
jgi:hypothetical protein